MNEIILSTQNGEPVASSRQIAENFEKRHDHVMRDIDSFKKDVPNFGEMFFEAEAPDSYGRPQRTYLMNRDGFSLLVMGFTGKAALEWKLKYIAAFNEMEKKLATPQMPRLSKEMQALFLLDDRTQKQEQRLTALENTMTVDYNQQRVLRKAISRAVISAMGGEDAPAYIATTMCAERCTASATAMCRTGSGSTAWATSPASALTKPWSTSSGGSPAPTP